MAQGNSIIVSADPRGKFEECTVVGTPKPGTVMELKAATAKVGGRFSYQVPQRASGAKGGIVVLLADSQGKLGVSNLAAYTGGPKAPGDAYVTGTRGFLYWPVAGEELNMVVTDVSGTADDVAIGDLFGVETLTGQLKANNSYGSAPFQAQEAVIDPTAAYVLWVKYLGNNA